MHYLARTDLASLKAATDKGPEGEDIWLPSGDPQCNRGTFNGYDVLIYGPMTIGGDEWFELAAADTAAFQPMGLTYVAPMKLELLNNAQVRAFYKATRRRRLRDKGRTGRVVGIMPGYRLTAGSPLQDYLGGDDPEQAAEILDFGPPPPPPEEPLDEDE